MKETKLHLNLLKASERRSSSPIRLRVMLPALALLALLGVLVRWGMVSAQLLLVRGQLGAARAELDTKKTTHAEILKRMGELRNYEAELEQLGFYAAGRRTYGALLRGVAAAIPPHLQISSISVPEPPSQGIPPAAAAAGAAPPPAPKAPFETVSLRVKGLAQKEAAVVSFMEALEGPAFEGALVIDRDPRSSAQSPKVHAFRQEDTPRRDGRRMILFDVEYRCPERRFEKK